MSKLRFLLPGLVAALALAGCSDDTQTKTEAVPDDLCARLQTVCNDETGQISCDPVDGQCKCGGKNGNGVVCGDGEVCHVDASVSPAAPSCVSALCDGVTCDRYESCDANDGRCKCAGVECGYGEVCIAGVCSADDPCKGVTCREGETCDPVDQTCKCGTDICSVGQSCRTSDGVTQCVGARCVGMNCPVGTECSPVDGLCHCGDTAGPACTAGQACMIDDATSTGQCEGHDICDGVVCTGGTTCSPLDGKCRCGGYDTASPICGADQTCDQTAKRCVGGNACATVTCTPGSNTSCDDEEGICKCGGTGGVVCGAEQGCVAGLEDPLCVTKCNPLTADVATTVCGWVVGQPPVGCYYSPSDSIAFCAQAGGAADGLECNSPTDCGSGSHCVQTADGGVCRYYCDTEAAQGAPNSCYQTNRQCVRLSGSGAVDPHLGVCLVVSAN